jgi:hypothetical protein
MGIVFLLVFVFHTPPLKAYLYILGFFVLYGFVRYSLVRRLRCPKCNTVVSDNVPLDYCPKCGADFSQPYVTSPTQ